MLQRLREYLTPGSMMTVAAVVGAGATAYSAYNSSRNSGQNSATGASTYVPQGQSQADDMWRQLMERFGGNVNSQADTLIPFLQQAFGQGSAELPGVQGRMRDVANLDIGAGRDMIDAAGQLRTAAADPQHAMYDRRLQQTQEGSRAATSMRGIGMSPQAAGIENDATRNFNTDWDYNALQRMIAGYDAAGRSATGGASTLGAGVGMNTGALQLPYSLAGSYAGAMGQGVYNPMTAAQNGLSAYMGLGQNASAQSFNQGQQNLGNFTQALGAVPWGQIQQWWGGNAGAPNSGSGASSWTDDTTWGGG